MNKQQKEIIDGLKKRMAARRALLIARRAARLERKEGRNVSDRKQEEPAAVDS